MTAHSTNRLPLYLQIHELILRELGAGRWRQGERLPTEAVLAGQFGVAIGTLRKALAALEKEGVLQRRQGSGTYVSGGYQGQGIYHFFRLESCHGTTGKPSAKVLSVQCLPVPYARQLLTPDYLDTHFWRIRRLRCLDDSPVAVEEICLPQSLVTPQSLSAEQLHESLYWYYRHHLNFWVAGVTDKVGLATLPDWGTQVLRLPAGSLCGWVERVAHDTHHKKVECSHTWFNPEQAHYSARWC